MLTALQTQGVNVRPNPGWETRTVPRGQTERTETLGVCNHWDAIKGVREDAYYISGNRFGGLIYNIVINRDGLVRLLGQRLTWNAGSGDPAILQALRDNRTPQPPQDRWLEGRPLTPVVSGNPWLFGVCINYHPDEGAIPTPQREALVRVNRVLVDHFGLSVNQIIDHRGWTRRKSDITTLNLAQFRHDVATLEEDDMSLKETLVDLAFEAGWAEPDTQAAREYWYAIDSNSPEWASMRDAIKRGARKLRTQSGAVDQIARDTAQAALTKLSQVKSVL